MLCRPKSTMAKPGHNQHSYLDRQSNPHHASVSKPSRCRERRGGLERWCREGLEGAHRRRASQTKTTTSSRCMLRVFFRSNHVSVHRTRFLAQIKVIDAAWQRDANTWPPVPESDEESVLPDTLTIQHTACSSTPISRCTVTPVTSIDGHAENDGKPCGVVAAGFRRRRQQTVRTHIVNAFCLGRLRHAGIPADSICIPRGT
jgi:hypothetical protein